MIGAAVKRPVELQPLPGLRELQTLLWVVNKKDEIATLLDQIETARQAANKLLTDQYESIATAALARMTEAEKLFDGAKRDSDEMLTAARDQVERLTRAATEHEAECAATRLSTERFAAAKGAELAAREVAVAKRESESGAMEVILRDRALILAGAEAELKERQGKLLAIMGG